MDLEDEQLIVAVQTRCAIYDKSHPKHRNRDTLRFLWKEVADEVGIHEVERIKKRWGYLRDYFLKQYRDNVRGGTSGQSAMRKRKWPLYDSLSFLIPHVEHRETSGIQAQLHSRHVKKSGEKSSEKELPVGDVWSDDDDNTEPIQELNVLEESLDDPTNRSFPPGGRKRPFGSSHSSRPKRRFTGEVSPCDLEVRAALKETDPSQDDDDHFFKSLKPMLRQLDTVTKLIFRTEVQNLLIQLLRPSSSTSSTSKH